MPEYSKFLVHFATGAFVGSVCTIGYNWRKELMNLGSKIKKFVINDESGIVIQSTLAALNLGGIVVAKKTNLPPTIGLLMLCPWLFDVERFCSNFYKPLWNNMRTIFLIVMSVRFDSSAMGFMAACSYSSDWLYSLYNNESNEAIEKLGRWSLPLTQTLPLFAIAYLTKSGSLMSGTLSYFRTIDTLSKVYRWNIRKHAPSFELPSADSDFESVSEPIYDLATFYASFSFMKQERRRSLYFLLHCCIPFVHGDDMLISPLKNNRFFSCLIPFSIWYNFEPVYWDAILKVILEGRQQSLIQFE